MTSEELIKRETQIKNPEILSPESEFKKSQNESTSDLISTFELSVQEINEIDQSIQATTEKLADVRKSLGLPIIQEDPPSVFIQRGKIGQIKNYLKKTLYTALASTTLMSSDVKETQSTEDLEQMTQRAKIEMTTKGITSEQALAYKPGVTDLVYRAIGPTFSTPGTKESWNEIYEMMATNLIEGRETRKNSGEDLLANNKTYEQMEDNPGEEDSWRLYLGLPQKYNTYTVSDYRPTNSKDEKYYFDFNNKQEVFSEALSKKGIVEFILKKFGDKDKISSQEVGHIIIGSRIMSNFQWSKGEDEKGSYLAYYDVWDLDVPLEKNKGFIGKPFEIYGRIYYDSQTFEIKH
jgi:hypothetical protein